MDVRLGMVEARFADIVWKNAPLPTRELIALCQQELNWKRTTTYTVLKKFCERGVFALQDKIVSVKVSREDFHAIRCEEFVKENYQGSLPAFVAAFVNRCKPSAAELEELRKLLDSFGGK